MTDFEYVRANLSDGEILTMLAEEASELAQAALKLRRTIVKDSYPTPVSHKKAIFDLHCELADVIACWKLIEPSIEDDGGWDKDSVIWVLCDANFTKMKKRMTETEP